MLESLNNQKNILPVQPTAAYHIIIKNTHDYPDHDANILELEHNYQKGEITEEEYNFWKEESFFVKNQFDARDFMILDSNSNAVIGRMPCILL